MYELEYLLPGSPPTPGTGTSGAARTVDVKKQRRMAKKAMDRAFNEDILLL